MRTLIACGDSWAHGTDLCHPDHDEDIPLRNTLEPNVKFREKNKFMKLLADKMNVSKIVDLSRQGGSNDMIMRTLLNYLSNNEYTQGKETNDLFVCIVWTSPERTEFNSLNCKLPSFESDGFIQCGPWLLHAGYRGDKNLEHFFNTFHKYLWSYPEMIYKYLHQVYMTQTLLQSLNINYVMAQAFIDNSHYHSKSDHKMSDLLKTLEYDPNFNRKKLWDSIDSKRFIHKNKTLYSFLLDISDKLMYKAHPNLEGHKIIADHIYNYCLENKFI